MSISPDALVALITLTVLEIILGIDNLIFITLLSGRLPASQQRWGRRLGIGIAVVSRLGLLALIQWIEGLRDVPVFSIQGYVFTYHSLVLLGGGIFLLAKATHEIHAKLEAADGEEELSPIPKHLTLPSMLIQVAVIDFVFSLDSVITAVGIARQYWVMVTAILIASSVMIVAVESISRFLEAHPSMKMLALSFLILIGALLIIEGWIPEKAEQLHLKNYAYFAMAFSFFVELLNIRVYRQRRPVKLRKTPRLEPSSPGQET